MKILNLFTVLIIAAFLAAAFAPAGYVLAQENRTASVIPTIKAPLNTIITKTPTYTWTKVANATRYQYQVYLGTVNKWDKVVYASACGSTNCAIKPALILGYYVYKWRVRAMVANTWYNWSTYKTFTVSPPSFYSGFSNSLSGWSVVNGVWNTAANEINTLGVVNKYVNIYRAQGKYADFDYSVKAKLAADGWGEYSIFFRLGGTSLDPSSALYPGYQLIPNFGEVGNWVLFRNEGGTRKSIASGNMDVWNDNNWNTIRVVAYGTTLTVYINGILEGSVTDGTYSRGYVGIGVMEYVPGDLKLFSVDWAKLTVIGKLADYEKALQSR